MNTLHLFCFTTIFLSVKSIPDEIKLDIENKISITIPHNCCEYIKLIKIDSKVKWCEVCSCDEAEPDKVNAFYSALTCKFATWTLNKIYHECIHKYPDFYYTTKFERHYKNFIELSNFIERLKIDLKDINEYIIQFRTIIDDFLRLNSHASYYSDKTILKIFVSIEIKFGLILTEGIKKKTQIDIIQMVIEEIIALQSFLSINCSNQSASSKNSRFYDFWLEFDDIKEEYNKKSKFILQTDIFNVITTFESLNLDKNIKKAGDCNVQHILLNNMKIKDAKGSFFEDISNTRLRISGNINKSISDMLDLINIERNENANEIDLPVYFEDGFDILSKVVDICPNDKTDTQCIHLLSILKSYHTELTEGIGLTHLNSYSCDLNQDLDSSTIYLQTILEFLKVNINELTCFNKYFKWLRNERYDYYVPYMDNKYRFLYFEPEHKINKFYKTNEGCDFVLNIYTLCYQVVMFLNNGIDNLDTKKDTLFLTRAQRIIDNIVKCFLTIITYNEQIYDRDLINMSYNITILLISQRDRKAKYDETLYYSKRIFNVVMNELNTYGIKHCDISKRDFLLFNNINFMEFGVGKSPTEMTINLFKKSFNIAISPKSIDDKNLESDEYGHLNLNFLHRNFIKKSGIINQYNSKIMIYWKGKKLSFLSIIGNMMKFCIQPKFLFAFYDMYFKFHIAVLFWEVRDIINKEKKWFTIENLFADLRCVLSHLNDSNFPSELLHIVKQIQLVMSLKIGDEIDLNHQNIYFYRLGQKSNEIEDKFKKLNFVFEKMNKTQKILLFVKSKVGMCSTSRIGANSLDSELKNVHRVLELFFKFRYTF
ncbi:Hypothetical protein CINCED_3A012403 [Cinara cedri]|uniref:Uncharacterized protein n=1 Tax=Cinara cedri TaxID=506608 RepID=A0A5E4NAR6_9HEMI|nr:Hypothetical protein CINCED_3A012403 [Cinara cedri]